jgi:ribosome-binding factor A
LKLSEITQQTSRDEQTKKKHAVTQCRIYKSLSEAYKLLGESAPTRTSIMKGLDAAKGYVNFCLLCHNECINRNN